MPSPRASYFATPAAWRAWLGDHHAEAHAVLVGFHKRGTGKPSITWPESVDEALCFGWIDGVRKRVDDARYTIRFTPRKPKSIWSAINIARAKELSAAGKMHPAGLAAFAARADERSAIYSYEQRKTAKLDDAAERRFRADDAAWAWFSAQAPWYRRTAVHWVISAKREQTRERRLATLIDDSRRGRAIGPLVRRTGK